MTCYAFDCENNNGRGYCENSSYVIITEDGECEDYFVPSERKDGADDDR